MNDKMSAMIAFVSFSAAAAAHVAILPAIIAFELTRDSTVAFWVYIASLLPITIVCGGALLATLRALIDASREPIHEYEWVTVTAPNGKKRAVKVPKIYIKGDRSVELEQHFRDN